jgi:hypothetical protein
VTARARESEGEDVPEAAVEGQHGVKVSANRQRSGWEEAKMEMKVMRAGRC